MPEPLRAVDTNVLLRYLLNDIPDQAERARRLIDSDEPIGITPVALAEIAWVLTGPLYRQDQSLVATELITRLARDNVQTLGFDKIEGQTALLACAAATGAANFGDALIAASARSARVQEIYSFDRRFTRAGMIPVLP